jgi:Bacterial Ig-like domain/Bacterial Ig domain
MRTTAKNAWKNGTRKRRRPGGLSKIRIGLKALVLVAVSSSVFAPSERAQVTANTPVFGPQTYVRTTGVPNEYTTTFTAPAWIVSPYNLHIANGDSNGNNRVSSATIALNGVQIAGPSDFNQNVATIDRSVTLQATNTLQVTLASKPGSYLTINVFGTNGDHTAPQIKIVTPAANSYINTATPNIEVTYSDPVGAGEPAASGINTSSFKATIDGVDRASLFTVRTTDASATLPSSLALSVGAHTLVISLQDHAGNQATATSQFTVDLGTPQLQITQPVLGAYLKSTTPTISIQYSDSVGVNLSTLKVLINGADETSLFTKTNTGATAILPATSALPQGATQIVAQIQNLAGTSASASTSFNIDTTPPTISIAHPAPNSYHGSSTVDVIVQYTDDQAIDTTTLQVTLDGASLSITKAQTSATGSLANVANGAHILAASIADLAGNVSTVQSTFYVDTSIPTIHVDQPAPNAIVSTHTPQVSIDYSDILGVDTNALKVFVNGTDFTSLFSIGPSGATAQLSGAATLSDGPNSITVQITNLAGTTATSSSTFTVDTIPPTIVFQAPPAQTNSNTPIVTVAYSDSGSGVNPYSLKLTLDGADVSSLIAPGATSATGVLQVSPPLTDGTHQMSATVADRAGNVSQPATLSFVVDTKPPVLTFLSPANNSFINNPTPSITLQYSDGTGVGVDSSSIHVQLQQGSNPPTDITTYFQTAAQQATGSIPAAVSLSDGTYTLTGVASDLVGNQGTTSSTFVVDTVPPTGTIQAPASNAILNTASVSVILSYSDDRSGVDTSKLLFTVDGTNHTSVLTLGPTQATGTLPPLSDGTHTIQLTVFDRAGNSSGVISQTFTTDTTPPTIAVSVSPTPNAVGWSNTNVTVTFSCSDTGSGVSTCPAPIAVATEGANQQFCGQAVDAAGNTSTPACATVKLDKTPPTITYSVSPTPNSNGVYTTVPVTITFACSDSLSGVASCPSPITINTLGINQVFSGTATDVAGNTATASVPIQTVAPKAPMIAAMVSPPPNGQGWNNANPTVSFVCTPGTYPLASCSSPVTVTTEGAKQSICGAALDNTGLSASACATVSLDKTPPTITATPTPAANSNGWNNTPVSVTFTCSDSLSGVATCPALQTISIDGAHQVVSGTALDVAGNSATAQITLNIQQTPPTILQFTAPSQIAPGQSGTASLTASDSPSGITTVVFQLNGATLATLSLPPYTVTFTAPATANAGDTLTLSVSVADAAGNANSSARGIQVVLAGVVTGQVLSDATGLPFVGASVQTVGGNGQDTSDNSGRYSIPSNSPHLVLSISTTPNPSAGVPATVTVERDVSLQSGVGTVPVDARLTPIAAPISVNTSGGSLTAGAVTIAVAPGALSSATNFHLTSLSQQGLPGLLPLGWSPVTAFDLRADSSTSAAFNATVTQLAPSQGMHLVKYDYNSHSWLMVTPNLVAVNGSLTVPIPSVGDFALAVADAGSSAPTIPSAGQSLAGVAMVTLPAGSSASGSLNPLSVSPTGGTSLATLAVQSSVPLPSGTVIQSNVLETYTLTSGKQLSDAKRTEDILLYQYSAPSGSAGVATFPVTPSQTFQPGQLSSGDVHLDILSGRESIRGQVGGSDAATVTGGDATLTVAAASLPQDTAIAVTPVTVNGFLPSNASLIPLAEYNIDFSGQVLNSAAQLSVAAGTAQQGDNVFLAQIQRINGVPYLVVVSFAQVKGANLVTQAAPGLSGITQGGDYVFYKVTSPTGYVSGTITSSSGPVAAVVQTNGLPFVAFSNFSGAYVIPALAGTVNLSASVPNTALAGTASVQVNASQTTTANLSVIGQIESAVIAPPNGAVGVPLTAEIDITAPDPFNQAAITATSVTLTQNGQGTNTAVPIRFVFSLGGTRLSVFPQSALQPSTTYTLAASGLANVLGGLIAVPTVTFTTQAITPPSFKTDALVFGMPDQNGNIQISAPANSFPPGSTILLMDQTNGIVLSLTVFNDGSVSGQMPATIDDVLAVTITAPDKTTATFTRSQFVAPDGTTAVGLGGGTVSGPGNTSLIIPQGTLNKGATFKLTLLDQTAFPQLPSWPGLNFGSGMRVDAPAMPTFNKEVKLAFPVPAGAPGNAFYYVYRRITDQNGKVYFETIDHAFVQGTGANAQVVTASPPFCGYHNPTGNFNIAAAASFTGTVQFSPFQTFVLMWDIAQPVAGLPGIGSPGLIVGLVQQIVPPGPGQPFTTYQKYVNNVIISLDADQSQVATYNAQCSTFTIFDPHLGGGTRSITATDGTNTIHAAVDEVNGIQVSDATYAIYAGLENQYRNIGRVTLTFPPSTPVPPPPLINIGIFTLDSSNQRQPIQGIIQSGVPLVITFATSSTLTVTGATINSSEYAVTPDSAAKTGDGLKHYILSGSYSSQAAGTYTIVATALDSLDPTNTVNESRSFLVVAAGGSNSSVTVGAGPVVINSIPLQNARRVPVTTFPTVAFSEPVKNVPVNITFTDAEGNAPPVVLVGIRSDGTVANPVGAGDFITSLTVQPIDGLKYNEQYTLTLGAGIVDQNAPALSLQVFTLRFATTTPQELGSTPSSDTLSATRGVVIGDRVYLGEYVNATIGGLDIVDITDPSNPVDKGVAASFIGRAMDAAGEASSPVPRCQVDPPTASCTSTSGGPLVAVAAGQPGTSDLIIPSNVWLYDVSTPDQPVRVGAVSATTSTTQDGLLLRIFMKDQFLYTSTAFKGLQVIDLNQAVAEYQSVFSSNPSQFGQSITTEGNGFATDTVVNTIPLYATNFAAIMNDLKAADYVTGPPPSNNTPAPTQTLIVATGRVPLVVADPQKPGPNGVLYPPADAATPVVPNGNPGAGLPNLDASPLQSIDGKFLLSHGQAIALGVVSVAQSLGNTTPEQIAVIVGSGTAPVLPDGSQAQGVLVVVNMNDPKNPVPQGFVGLSAYPTDVVLHGSVAIIGTSLNKVLLVNLTDPAQPIAAGEIDPNPGMVLGNRLTVTDSGLIISSSPNPATGGVQVSKLDNACRQFRAQIQNGAKVDSVPYPLRSLDWTIGNGTLSPQDGFVLEGVQLGDRLMANKMSLPYLILRRNSSDPSSPSFLRCVLSTNNPAACIGSTTAQSHLLEFQSVPSNGDSFVLQAKYLLDYLDGDTDKDSTKPDSCVLVTQRYEFWREGYDAPETSDELSAARFKPKVSYEYFTDSGPAIQSFNAAQRFQFAPTQFQYDSTTSPPSFHYVNSTQEIATLFADCETADLPLHALDCFPVLTDPKHEGVTTFGLNPLPQETAFRVVENGQMANPQQHSDNLHLRSMLDQSGVANTPVEGPTVFGHPGCPECVHIHWRWGSLLDRDHFPGKVIASPRFNNNKGNPIIPVGSHQDVDIGILAADAQEEHPTDPDTFVSIAGRGKTIDPGVALSFWYSGSGHASQDTFMDHGGFFSSLKVTISNPYIFDPLLGPFDPLPVQSFLACPIVFQIAGKCPILADIYNRTGHSITWTATLRDKNSRAIVATSDPCQTPGPNGQSIAGPCHIAGSPNQEIKGLASVYLPPGIQLFPTYILDVKVTDDVTGWSTERQAYVTPGP